MKKSIQISAISSILIILYLMVQISCSSDEPDNKDMQNWCVYPSISLCVPGSFSECPGENGILAYSCPYSSSSGSSSVPSSSSNPYADGPSVECLVGEWRLEEVARTDGSKASEKKGKLMLKSEPFDVIEGGKRKTGRVEYYEFEGGEEDIGVSGRWSVEGATITIITDATGESLSGTITLNGNDIMNVKSNTGKSVFSLLQDGSAPTPTERFTRR
jgi:hypothetical protein